ncbi:hypothetical protein [Klebsiella aerogenes]|uniref:hypothetical protein n=1 Tax=Klebsiella aerogenes TaxID=548 RepID=UPI002FF1C150
MIKFWWACIVLKIVQHHIVQLGAKMDAFDGSVKPLGVNEVKFRFIRITRFLPGRFPKSSDFRARLWGAAIRFLLKMGFTVGLVGYPAVGKSYLLARTLPEGFIDGRELVAKNNWETPVPFPSDNIPSGPVGIDEGNVFGNEALLSAAASLKKCGVVFTAQRLKNAESLAASLMARRVLIFYIGEYEYFKFEVAAHYDRRRKS